MALLDELKQGVRVKGLLPGKLVTVIDVKRHGPVVELVYEDAGGQLGKELLLPDREAELEIATDDVLWSFDADGASFRLTSEAYRINLAYLFDPLIAVHTSLIEPLPHQITAVYETMLGKQPLRYLLAEDPGAGKTIMTGLLIKELMIRGDLRRCLIVSPGNLVEQWQDELSRKFQITFDILSNDRLEASASGNAFSDMPLCIARLDKLSRDEQVQAKLEQSDWDLVVIDEAHKMSATFFSGEVKFTKRYQLGQLLGKVTRHLLLLTATPHNGKEEDFQLFMALLDQDRFEGRFREGVQKVDTSDLMRHLVKEQLYTFDGTPLFPERLAYTVNYKLSGLEETLYQEVSDYVCQEFNRADALENNGRKGTIGFALTTLSAVTARLTSESSYWDNRAAIFQAQEAQGKSNARQNWQKARERADDLYLDTQGLLLIMWDQWRRYSACRRVSRTIFLGSAPTLRNPNKGLTDSQIKLGCVQPGESVATFGDALRRLTDQATHLYQNDKRHWYSTQPSVARLAQDRADQYSDDTVFEDIEHRLKAEQQNRGDFDKVHVCPTSGGDIADDDTSARLVILKPALNGSETLEEIKMQPQPLSPLAVNASRRLKSEGMLLTDLSGILLRHELYRIPWWRGNHIDIRELAEYFAKYVYLPRLKSAAFAYAENWDEIQQRYLGLKAGQQLNPVINALLVKSEVAALQIAADAARLALVTPVPATQNSTTTYNDGQNKTKTAVEERNGAGLIMEEVVKHLTGVYGANVTFTLEIEARIPDGVPESTTRTVLENCAALKFKNDAFEAE